MIAASAQARAGIHSRSRHLRRGLFRPANRREGRHQVPPRPRSPDLGEGAGAERGAGLPRTQRGGSGSAALDGARPLEGGAAAFVVRSRCRGRRKDAGGTRAAEAGAVSGLECRRRDVAAAISTRSMMRSLVSGASYSPGVTVLIQRDNPLSKCADVVVSKPELTVCLLTHHATITKDRPLREKPNDGKLAARGPSPGKHDT
jgi:hypothetical protein